MKYLTTLIIVCFLLPLVAQEQSLKLFSEKHIVDQNPLFKSVNSHKRALGFHNQLLDAQQVIDLDYNISETKSVATRLTKQVNQSTANLDVFTGKRTVNPNGLEVILVKNNKTGKLVSLVEEEDKYYLILPNKDDNSYRVIENDKEELACSVVHSLSKSSAGPDDCGTCAEVDAEGKYILDVFIAFNQDAATMAGDAEAYAMTMVASVNNGLINSEINEMSLRLVGTGITDNNPGLVQSVLDDVLVWFKEALDENAADIIGVFLTQTGADGESGAWGQQPGRVSANNIIRPLSFRHEIGHNFGGAHCFPDNQAVAYANGYDNGVTSTHLCGNGANYFSSASANDAEGNPLGKNGEADMAKLIGEQAQYLSSFRLHRVPFFEGDTNIDGDGDGYCASIDCDDADTSSGLECLGQDFRMSYENTQNGSSAVVRDGLDVNAAEAISMTAWVNPAENFGSNAKAGIATGTAENRVTGLVASNGKLGVSLNNEILESTMELKVDEWSHIAMSVEGTNATVCLNGICEEFTINAASYSMNEEFVIGQIQSNTGNTFLGKIDELLVYNSALSIDEIRLARHLEKELTGINSIVAYYKFDEPLGLAVDGVSAKNAQIVGCARSADNAPVGLGRSESVTITAADTYMLPIGGMILTFSEGAGPNGKIYVTQITSTGDVNELETPASSSYWVINNYGENQSFDNLGSITFSDNAIESGSINLYQRPENSTSQDWSLLTSSSEITGTNVSFADSQITSAAQLFLGAGVVDSDEDGFGADVDCNDSDASINPEAEEIPNNDIDEDCDGLVMVIDADEDGANADIDCNDDDATQSPFAIEIEGNDVDENCDGLAFVKDAGQYGAYCAPSLVDSFGYITWVQFNTIKNQSDASLAAGGLSDFTSLVTSVTGGASYKLNVNSFLDFDTTQLLTVWIDFNRDTTFAADEMVFNAVSDFETWEGLIEIPDDVPGGNAFMRIRLSKASGGVIEACGDANGETEDYSIFIVADFDNDSYDSLTDCNDSDASINPAAEEIVNNDIDEDCSGADLLSSTFEIEDSKIEVFPNPVDNMLQIRISDNAPYRARLVDLTGKVVMANREFKNYMRVDVSELHAGIYFLELYHMNAAKRVVDKIEVIK